MRSRTLRLALAKATATAVTLLGSLILVAGLGLSGCSSDEGGGTPTFPVVGEDTALIRFGHLSPDAGTVDIIVNEGQAGSFRVDDVVYGVFSRFFEVPATFDGSPVNVKVRTGSGADAIDTTVEVLRGTIQTVAVIGKANPVVADGDGGFVDALRPTVIRSTLTQSPGEATVSFVHAAPSVPTVDVTLVGIDSPPVFAATSFGDAASVAIRVPRDEYSIQVRLTETGDVALTFADVLVEGNTIYTIWAVETPTGDIEAIVSIDTFDESSPTSPTLTLTPATASLRAAHLSAEAPNVQVLVNGAIVPGLESVAYETISGVLPLLAATQRVQIFAASDDPFAEGAEAVIDAQVLLAPGSSTTVAAIGEAGSGGVARPQIIDYDGRVPSAGNALVRFLHASGYNLAVKLALIGGESGPLETGESPSSGPITAFIEVPASTYTLGARVPAANNVQVATLNDVTLEDGGVYNVYFIGDATPPIQPGKAVKLAVDPLRTVDPD